MPRSYPFHIQPVSGTTPTFLLHIEHESGLLKVEQRAFCQKRLLIGRSAINELTLANPFCLVSRQHAQICYIEGKYWLSDLGSTNATLLNGRRLKECEHTRLHHGDCLKVGDYHITFLLEKAETGALNRCNEKPLSRSA